MLAAVREIRSAAVNLAAYALTITQQGSMDIEHSIDWFPTSTSSLLLPSASQNFSKTLSSLKRSTLSITNRLTSIQHDSLIVQRIAGRYKLPLIANERCGSWYIPPELKMGSVYFKSTDGHTLQWRFSTRRLNLHLLGLIGEYHGYGWYPQV